MDWAKRWQGPSWLIGAALAAGLIVAAAKGTDITYGVAASEGCDSPTKVGPDESLIKITEALSPVGKVANVTAGSDTTITSTNLKLGVARVTVGAGANIVYYDNEPVSPP